MDSLASVGDLVPLQQHIDFILEGLTEDFALVVSVTESKFEAIPLEEVEALHLAHEMRSERFKKKTQAEIASINLTHYVPDTSQLNFASSTQPIGNTVPNPNLDANRLISWPWWPRWSTWLRSWPFWQCAVPSLF